MSKSWNIPVLTYHGLHAPGWNYDENDHIALEHDLKMLESMAFKVIPLEVLVDHLTRGGLPHGLQPRVVAITFDDGTDLDYEDFFHPEYGYLKSLRNILKAFSGLGLDGGPPRATSFVIASPAAREELDRTCIAGRGQWNDLWWRDAAQEGVMTIANHSWDHTHPSLKKLVINSAHKGRFDTITDFASADAEILTAAKYIRELTAGLSQPYFAYPYGHFNEFLVNEYLPARRDWIEAAFTTEGRPVNPSDSRWQIPRFVCGDHWKSPEGLEEILRGQ